MARYVLCTAGALIVRHGPWGYCKVGIERSCAWGWIEAVAVESFLMVIKKSYVWSRITRAILFSGVISDGFQAVSSLCP
ncbi:hypothetical protein GPU96_11g22970 [Encephalitozoon hellem]|uniref:Uncharacterized protein n=1 Tax=Encephalitozoon hellem TaxID=27973 RepID=A0A9Q9F934_ENCHE|nr:hypothetical protein GPU96_01g00040 [Encephalitozoon hellem]UTX42512.1 hypothetical protein GPU96_01g02180 [Encephalitozoon hellem]UTX42515.1 hypothetical protein GPU96_02g02250 [Encephalitozoon hellem]UTX42687.1 hypothetical protein GPU96_02g04030 [Encephalitozoon hellem]UTX42690.1 hypothetical protein GPU96_03g04100 [Encephalitozoon hellem]